MAYRGRDSVIYDQYLDNCRVSSPGELLTDLFHHPQVATVIYGYLLRSTIIYNFLQIFSTIGRHLLLTTIIFAKTDIYCVSQIVTLLCEIFRLLGALFDRSMLSVAVKEFACLNHNVLGRGRP
jgi:hypothetical protein